MSGGRTPQPSQTLHCRRSSSADAGRQPGDGTALWLRCLDADLEAALYESVFTVLVHSPASQLPHPSMSLTSGFPSRPRARAARVPRGRSRG